jgi:hypothetical protein
MLQEISQPLSLISDTTKEKIQTSIKNTVIINGITNFRHERLFPVISLPEALHVTTVTQHKE